MAQATKLFDLSASAAARPFAAGAPPGLLDQQAVEPQGPRKLVRPLLPAHLADLPSAPRRLRGAAPLARHEAPASLLRHPNAAASHAESLYFQKQMQTQTPMVFVLEDGEQLRGVIEWFDRDTIKIRNTTRVLLFKRSIKYLYKAGGDQHS